MLKITQFILGLFVCIWGLNACKAPLHQKDELYIVCTTGMVADAVQQIVGKHAKVVALMGEGVDPHLYKATTGDLEKLYEADMVFYSGIHLEGKMTQIFKKMSRTKPVIAFGEGLIHEDLICIDSANHVYDPHIWFDVALWAKAVAYAGKQLSQIDTVHRNSYQQNLGKYLNELHLLDSLNKVQLQTIPPSQRLLITSHDAFGYFGRAYQIEVKGLQGISTVAEFGLRDISELVNLIINRKIKAIFVESSVSPKAIEAVVKGCQSKGHQVVIGGELYADAMGAANTTEGTYIGMVQANVAKIVGALR